MVSLYLLAKMNYLTQSRIYTHMHHAHTYTHSHTHKHNTVDRLEFKAQSNTHVQCVTTSLTGLYSKHVIPIIAEHHGKHKTVCLHRGWDRISFSPSKETCTCTEVHHTSRTMHPYSTAYRRNDMAFRFKPFACRSSGSLSECSVLHGVPMPLSPQPFNMEK